MGAVDSEGTVVSLFKVFSGNLAGLDLPSRSSFPKPGCWVFFLTAGPNCLAQEKPFHTLNPAMAIMNDGHMHPMERWAKGQPQTQAAIFSRYAFHGIDLQRAISAPRWLLGKTGVTIPQA